MNDVVTIIIAILSSGAFTAIVNAILAYRRSKKEKETGVAAGVRMLLYDRIKHLGKGYINRGCITSEELEDILSLHECYHDDLGGNGFLDSLMTTVKALPIKTKGEYKND